MSTKHIPEVRIKKVIVVSFVRQNPTRICDAYYDAEFGDWLWTFDSHEQLSNDGV